MKKLYLLFLLLLVLCSCAPAVSSPVETTDSTAQNISPYDGEWKGAGRTADGNDFTISFRIEHGAISGVSYEYEGPEGVPCFNSHYFIIPEVDQPSLTGDGFTLGLGKDMQVDAEFTSTSEASGHLIADVYYRYETCNGFFELDWIAQKQEQAAAPIAEEKPVSRKTPFETFFQILIFGLSNGAVLALNAIGVTLIYSTVRTLNLAHGDVFALSTVAVTSLVNAFAIQSDWPVAKLAGALLVVGVGAAVFGAGLSMGVNQLAFKPFRGHSRLAPLIGTLALSFILFQGALVWRTFQSSWIPGEHRSVPGLPEVPTDGIPNLLPNTNLIEILGIPSRVIFRISDLFVLGMALAFVLLATWFLQRTSTGRALRALAQNQSLAQMVGVNVDSTINRAFAVGGALAGAAAFIFSLYYGRPFGSHGAQSGLLAFTAALLGGIGSPVGALISSLSIGIFSALSDYYFSAQWTNALLLSLLIVLIAWRPFGLTASGGTDADSAHVRDSVILSAAGSGSRAKRQTTVFLIALGLIPMAMYLFGTGGQIILRSAAIFILLALGLNIALGLAGLLDFGFAASFGLGAYAAAITLRSGGGFWTALLIGIVFAALFGSMKGLLARRVRDDFLAVATLALGLLARQLIVNFDFTGSVNGFSSLPSLHYWTSYLLRPTMNFYLVFGFVLLAAFAGLRLTLSRTGRMWISSSEDETAALASGVNVPFARMFAFMVSSALAGLAGVLYASTFTYVDPELFSFYISSLTLTMVILGGAGSVPGVMIGAIAIILYDKVIVPQFADWLAAMLPVAVGSAPDIRGASYFNFGMALYITVLLRARRKKP